MARDGHTNYWTELTARRLARRRVLAAGGAGAFGAALVACGAKPQAGAPAGQSANQGAPGGGTPQSGGTYTYYTMSNPRLDPQKESAGSQQYVSGVYSRLFRFKTGPDPKTFTDHDLENDLGISAESPDAITWTVKMRPDAKFQNIAPVNGHAVEAEDVRATFTRVFDAATASPNRGSLDMIDLNQITTPDKQTVVFKLKYPYAPFKKTLGAPAYSWIYPREVLGGGYDPAKTVIGSGPFTIDSIAPDVAYTYKRNPDWFDKPRPYIDTLKIAVIADASRQQAEFAAGHLDELIIENPFDLDAVKQQSPQATMLQCPDGRPFPIYLQLSDPGSPFQDIRVRRAASMAIDREALSKIIYNGQGVSTLFVPASMGKWSQVVGQLDPSVAQWYKFNPSEAKKMLDAAGQSNLALQFAYISPGPFTTPPYVKMGETISNMWNQAGIKTNIVQQDYNKDYIDAGKGSRAGYFDKNMVIYSGIASYTEADEFLYINFHSKSTNNDEQLKDPKLDAMIDKERTIVDENERLKAVQEIEKYIADQAWLIPTQGSFRFAFLQPRVQNYSYTDTLGRHTENYSKVWLKS
ncbi:MAG TPA: ABC transporter substrate-binding protein [Dehalococcoidia bacterium]|nr:ABC transporter substrate-binding protein [Dehalococcoidia bacterium]